jgi:hypothetical protein
VRLPQILAHPTHRMDAEYWLDRQQEGEAVSDEAPAKAEGRLYIKHEYYCDTGAHSGMHFVRLEGYVTPEELADLRGEFG